MPILSDFARKKKIEYFFKDLSPDAKILEIGCAGGWVGNYFKKNGWNNYIGLDIVQPADIVGDINNWKYLNMKENSFDIIIAFEVVEHVDCFKACYDLLKSGGKMFLTTPLPHMDIIMKFLENIGLNQKRTSHHNNLIYIEKVPFFEKKNIKIVSFLSQWAILSKK